MHHAFEKARDFRNSHIDCPIQSSELHPMSRRPLIVVASTTCRNRFGEESESAINRTVHVERHRI